MSTPTSQASESTDWRSRRATKPNTDIPQLSCELCRKRKVKCDKSNPCSNCVKSDVACVPIYRKRLPRGRHANPRPFPVLNDGDELMNRIRRLEALASNMNELKGSSSKPGRAAPTGPDATDLNAENDVGWRFWAQIADEVEGLRDIVGPPSDDEESVWSTPKSTPTTSLRIFGVGSSSGNSLGATGNHLNGPNMTAQLCQVYLQQVDPIAKVLHRPSLSRFMQSGENYLGYESNHISTICLRSAVCYSAVASMTEEQCQTMFNSGKNHLMAHYRSACEAALENSELLTTSDITIIQAFVLYLVARRTEDSSRAIWTMVSLAIRIAKAVSIHLIRNESFFSRQIKRRLWFTICLLDLQASFEQATEPLVEPEAVCSGLPMNINDSDFDFDTPGEPQSREGLTDMTFALVTYHAQLSGRLLNFHSKAADSLNWEEREEQASLFEQKILSLLRFCDPESSSYAWFTFHGAQSLVASMRLAALRPLHRVHNRPAPRGKFIDILNDAVRTLDKVHLIRTHPKGEGFRWYVIVQWHALASAIAECYVGADVTTLRTAWPIIEAAFEHHKADIETYRRGMLKKPLERLMMQAKKKIDPILQGSDASQASSHSNILSYPMFAADQTDYDPYAGSSTTTSANLTSLNQIDHLHEQQLPQQSMMPLDFDFDGMNIFSPLDNSAVTPSSVPSWSTSPMASSQNPETNSFPEANSGAIEDISWRTWEEFVSGISFDDSSRNTI